MPDSTEEVTFLLETLSNVTSPRVPVLEEYWVEEFGSTRQLVTLGPVDCTVGTDAQRFSLEDLDFPELEVLTC